MARFFRFCPAFSLVEVTDGWPECELHAAVALLTVLLWLFSHVLGTVHNAVGIRAAPGRKRKAPAWYKSGVERVIG